MKLSEMLDNLRQTFQTLSQFDSGDWGPVPGLFKLPTCCKYSASYHKEL